MRKLSRVNKNCCTLLSNGSTGMASVLFENNFKFTQMVPYITDFSVDNLPATNIKNFKCLGTDYRLRAAGALRPSSKRV